MKRLSDEGLRWLERRCGNEMPQQLAGFVVAVIGELRERRAADAATFDATVVVMPHDDGKPRRVFLSGRDMELIADVRDFIQVQIDGGADTCGEHRLQVALLDRLLSHRGGG